MSETRTATSATSAIVALCLVGCGDGDATPDAALADVTPVEVCNGVDDTGDGAIDEGCPCVPFDATFSRPVDVPRLVWIGDGYLVTTSDRGLLELAQVAPDGTLGPSFTVGDVANDLLMRSHDMAWSGSTLAVVRRGTDSVHRLTVLDPYGAVLQEHALPAAFWTSVTWAGDRFVVAGTDMRANDDVVRIAEIDRDGAWQGTTYGVRHPREVSWVTAAAASDRTLVLATTVNLTTGVVVVDRATRASAFHALQFDSSSPMPRVTRSHDRFVVHQSSQVQLFDAAGEPGYSAALPWGAQDGDVAPWPGGFAAVAIMAAPGGTWQYAAAKLDAFGHPIESPIVPFGQDASVSGRAYVRAASADKRLALAHAHSNDVLRVIQHCE